MITKNSHRNQRPKSSLRVSLAAVFVLAGLFISACSSLDSPTYTKTLSGSEEGLWLELLEGAKAHGFEIKKADNQKKRAKAEILIPASEIATYAKYVPENIFGDAQAEIELWLEPGENSTSQAKARAVIYADSFEYQQVDAFNPNPADRYRNNSWRDPNQDYRRELVPTTLESNGRLELEVLGYEKEDARKMVTNREVRQELDEIKKSGLA